MKEKKWILFVVIGYFLVLFIIGGFMVIVDPYFHYHAPIDGIYYALDKEAYVNDGVSKHFEYDALLTGTSLTLFFRTEEMDELFDRNFVRLSFQGEGFKRINDNLRTAIASNENLDLVIRGLDPLWFIASEDFLGYSEYPDYLYDEKIWNDVNYLYNKEIIFGDAIPDLACTIRRIPAQTFDSSIPVDWETGEEVVLGNYERTQRQQKDVTEEETKQFFDTLEKNMKQNVLSTIEENPEIDFYVFFPPYSILFWDGLNQNGTPVLQRRIAMEKYVIECLLPYDNVKLFSFNNDFDLVCDLNNYIDECHYLPKVSSQILHWIKEGKYELTEDNYQEYIESITEFYTNYDYDSIYE